MTPSNEFQLGFLKQLQRIFNEGEFVATYKFALLHAIADICVERADDATGQIHIPLRDLGEKFLELYWNHAGRYKPGAVIRQNTMGQAAIVSRLEVARDAYKSLATFQASKDWRPSVTFAATQIEKMPLWRLQTLGGKEHEFLYSNRLESDGIKLRPGVSYCLRSFYPLVLHLVRGHWISHIRRIPANNDIVGKHGDLEDFLFGSPRKALEAAKPVLVEVQAGKCFYCNKPMHEDWHVDHFVPWSRYPRDLGHNFVLSHDKCNLAKRDTLAARMHVEHWLERNDTRGAEIATGLEKAFMCDVETSRRVTKWSYELEAQTDARLWLKGRDYEPFDKQILALL